MIRFIFATVLLSACMTVNATPKIKIIEIVVNAKGEAFIGKDTLDISDLAPEIQKRLWRSYLGTGKMYDSIKVEFAGEVLMGTRGAVRDAVQLGQKNALIDLCLEKHKKLFEKCSEAEQRKIRKQFPVLFQKLN